MQSRAAILAQFRVCWRRKVKGTAQKTEATSHTPFLRPYHVSLLPFSRNLLSPNSFSSLPLRRSTRDPQNPLKNSTPLFSSTLNTEPNKYFCSHKTRTPSRLKQTANMPLIVGDSRTMSSPEPRFVKRPSKQETRSRNISLRADIVLVVRAQKEAATRTPPRSSPLLPILPTQRSTINFDPNIDLNTAKELFNIISCITADLHRNVRNPVSTTSSPPAVDGRAAHSYSVLR
jgi:hypothetical protein